MFGLMEHAEIIEGAGSDRWDYFFQQLPPELQDIHFTSAYHRMYERNGDGSARVFVWQQNEKIYFYPFLLRPIPDTLWFDIETAYGYTGPVSSSGDSAFLREADQAFCDYCREKNVISEFVRFHPLIGNDRLARDAKGMAVSALREYVWVDLAQPLAEIEKKYSSPNRNKIRKAEKNNVRVVRDHEGNYFHDFVRIYRENMQHLNASAMYFFTQPFYDELQKLTKTAGMLMVALQNDTPIATAVFLKGKTMGHYFLSSATQEGKKVAAANLLLHHGIIWCHEQDLKQMHLGGGMTGDAQDPLLLFKKNFSSDVVTYHIGKRIHREDIYRKLCADWDVQFAPMSADYSHMLQRYRLTLADIQVREKE